MGPGIGLVYGLAAHVGVFVMVAFPNVYVDVSNASIYISSLHMLDM